jgi:hypothetical protein
MIDAFIVLVRADADMIAGLKIADFCRLPFRIRIFGRARNREGGDGLVVGLNDEAVVRDLPDNSREVVRFIIRLPALALPALRISPAALGIAPRRIASRRISAARVAAAGVSAGVSAPGHDDLAKTGSASQQDNGR